MNSIVVTGIGIITAIGNSLHENRQSLIAGKTGIGKASFFTSKYASSMPFGEVKISDDDLKKILGTTHPGITRTDLLGLYALQQAISDALLTPEILQEDTTAFISANTVGGMCLTDELYKDARAHKENASSYLEAYPNSASTLFLQDYYNIGGIVNTFNTACSSSANAIMYGARLIKHGLAKRVIAGGIDALAKFTVNGFNALMILSSQPCRPFDRERTGLNLGEGAAFIVMEREEDAVGKNIYAEVKGYGNSNDAFHASSTSDTGDGPFLSMQSALTSAKLQPRQINFINAHGTATENNDLTESVAMLRLFSKSPLFASTKSYTGHTLGAAGAVEAVYSILNIYHQEIYPSLHFEQPIDDTGLAPVTEYAQMDLQHVMSNSFGFGGNCSSLVFSKI